MSLVRASLVVGSIDVAGEEIDCFRDEIDCFGEEIDLVAEAGGDMAGYRRWLPANPLLAPMSSEAVR
jgi:hypothetical protein